MKQSRLRFNFGFLLEAGVGTMREIELDYPEVRLDEEIALVPLKGSFLATRTTEGIYVQGTLHSTTTLPCTRCLEDAIIPISISLDELFYYPPSLAPDGEAVIGEDGFIDLSPVVREMSMLDIPIKVLCRPDCQGLCQVCGQDLNQGDCGCPEDDIDPRFSILQKLLDESEE